MRFADVGDTVIFVKTSVVPVGTVTALASNVTAVCANALPFSVAPVFIPISVLDNTIPLKSAVVPSVAWPATCQKMFLA